MAPGRDGPRARFFFIAENATRINPSSAHRLAHRRARDPSTPALPAHSEGFRNLFPKEPNMKIRRLLPSDSIRFLFPKRGPAAFFPPLLALLVLFLSGCAFFSGNAALVPLRYPIAEDERPGNLVVFLRGRGGSHRDFERLGFVDAVRERGLPYDMLAPNAHIGYYFAETLVSRLKTDLIEPARAEGYENIWLVGASMGGLGATLYLKTHPEDIAGVVLISPFLGYDEIVEEIAAAGGLAAWSPGAFDPADDWERMLWSWLREEYAGNAESWPPIHLGYGDADFLVGGQRLLATILPAERVMEIPGAHRPDVMKRIWLDFLDRGVLGEPDAASSSDSTEPKSAGRARENPDPVR
jgi:pimeloyl-ACP methyl ester carboxylesterase